MSNLNLLPWRERQREQAMRRWGWGTFLACLSTLLLVWLADCYWQEWQQQRHTQKMQWIHAQQTYKQALTEGALWQTRSRLAKQIKSETQLWQMQQQHAWRALARVLAQPPLGVQMTQLEWQDQQLLIHGWTVSAAHLQRWQEGLQAQRVEFHDAQWRQADGLAFRQHAFVLKWQVPVHGAGS